MRVAAAQRHQEHGETSEKKSHPMQDSSQASGIMQSALYPGVVRQIAK